MPLVAVDASIGRYSAVPQAGNMIAPIAPADRNADYLQPGDINHLTSGQRSGKIRFHGAAARRRNAGRDR